MFKRIVARVRRLSLEDFMVGLFGASFFIGIWYALPMVNTITDVWSFGGGVLRAMEAHTLLPGIGVDYGTLSFYQNYVAMVVALAASIPFFGFDITALKTTLILNPSYSLIVPRIGSALTSLALLGVVYRFLKAYIQDAQWRLALLMLTFGSVLTTLLVRSGKMWMLSLLLIVASFIYLYRAVTEEREKGQLGWLSFTSVMTAFLAASNFLFAGLFLVNIPVLLFVFWRTPAMWKRLAAMVAFGAAVFLGLFALNAGNVVEQASGFVMQFFNPNSADASVQASLTVLESFTVNARQAVESFPLLLVALIPVAYAGIRDKTLFSLAALYSALYMIAVSVVFRTDQGLALNVRHIAPIGFFLLFLLASCKPPARFVSRTLLMLGFTVYVYTLVLLSIPTTYNAAYDFIEKQYSGQNIRIDEHIFEMTLPMNKASYALVATPSCGSACEHTRVLPDDIAFKPRVVTELSDEAMVATLPPPDLVVVERAIAGCTPLARFGNDVSDDEIFDIDINLGRMLLPSFYRLHRLGKNVYVYDAKMCQETIPFSHDAVDSREQR